MVVFINNLYKSIASQIYRHYENQVLVVVLVLNRSAKDPHYTFQKWKMCKYKIATYLRHVHVSDLSVSCVQLERNDYTEIHEWNVILQLKMMYSEILVMLKNQDAM